MTLLTFPEFQTHFERQDWVLPRVLEHQAATRPDAPYLQWTDANPAMTFAEVNAEVNRLAHGLAALGVGKGDKVALFLPNCLEYPLLWFALNKLGAAEVTIGNDFKGQFLRHPLALSESRMVVTTPALSQRLVEFEGELEKIDMVILLDDPEEPAEPATFSRMKAVAYAQIRSARDDNPGIEVDRRDLAAILFTSGTTGPSKAVMMCHAHHYFFSEEIIRVCQLTEDDVYMSSFPFFHANAQLETIYPSMIAGIRCVLYRKFSASDWIGRIRRSGTTVTNLLGATMSFVSSQPERPDDRDHKLRCIFAAPVPGELCGRISDRYGFKQWATGFGQTEISMPFLSLPGQPIPSGACGVAMTQFYDIALGDPQTGEPVEGATTGELLIRTKVPGITTDGFLGMPEKTVEAWRDLWFHSGDVMRRDENGWYYFIDRLKDTLRRRGENISSAEVEDVIAAHPSVGECCVVGVPADEEGGEDEVMVFIAAAEGREVIPAEIIAFSEPRMPGFAVPRYIEVVDELPKTPTGKPQKVVLRKRGIGPATWDRLARVKA